MTVRTFRGCIRVVSAAFSLAALLLAAGGGSAFSEPPPATEDTAASAKPEAVEEAAPEAEAEEEGPGPLFTWTWEPVKFATVGETRVRVETFDNYDFDDRIDDQDTLLALRFRFGFEADAWDRLLLHVEGQDAEEIGSREDPDQAEDGPDLRRLYLSLHDLGPLTVTVGRQDLAFGKERIIGPYEFGNLDHHFDAARLEAKAGPFAGGVFLARPVNQTDGHFNHAHHDISLIGAHASWQIDERVQAEALYVHGEDDRELYGELIGEFVDPDTEEVFEEVIRPAKDLRLNVFDLRVAGTVLSELLFDVEAATEWGHFGDTFHRAWAVWAEAGWTFRSIWAEPYVGVAHNYSTGDRNPADERTETWVPLFTNIPNYGFYNWANLHETVFTLGLEPIKDLKFQADYRMLRLAQKRDALYSEAGEVYLSDPTGEAGTDVGAEMDLWIGYTAFERVEIEAAYSFFLSGSFARTVSGDDAAPTYGYLSARVRF